MKITTQSVCPAFFGLCAFASLSLLLELNGLFHRSTNVLLQVVVVGKVLALDAFLMGVISCFFAVSSAAASLCHAMTAEASACTTRVCVNRSHDNRLDDCLQVSQRLPQ